MAANAQAAKPINTKRFIWTSPWMAAVAALQNNVTVWQFHGAAKMQIRAMASGKGRRSAAHVTIEDVPTFVGCFWIAAAGEGGHGRYQSATRGDRQSRRAARYIVMPFIPYARTAIGQGFTLAGRHHFQ